MKENKWFIKHKDLKPNLINTDQKRQEYIHKQESAYNAADNVMQKAKLSIQNLYYPVATI